MQKMISPDRSVLVWGGLGFLGRHLVTRLLDDGYRVSVLCRSRGLSPVPQWASEVEWFEFSEHGDNHITLARAVSSASIIYDFAGSSGAMTSNRDPLESLDSNCRAQLEMLKACEAAGHNPHVVLASSWLVYGETGDEPINERTPPAPRSMYAAHKLAVEHYLNIFARRNRISYTVCRISNPYGFDESKPGKTYKVLNSFIEHALENTPITLFGDGGQLRDFIYVSDLVDALMLCGTVEAARNEVFNISRGKSYSMREAVETIRDLVGAPAVIFKPWPEEYKAVESGDYIADISKAREKLGFNPIHDLKTGLEATIARYRHLRLQQSARAANTNF